MGGYNACLLPQFERLIESYLHSQMVLKTNYKIMMHLLSVYQRTNNYLIKIMLLNFQIVTNESFVDLYVVIRVLKRSFVYTKNFVNILSL